MESQQAVKKILEKLGVRNFQDFKALFWQFIKFGLVGLSNTAVSLAVYYLVLWLNPSLYVLGSILGTIISIANAFFWNDRFVFKGNDNSLPAKMRRLGKTYVSYGGTSALSTFLLWLEVAAFGVSKTWAPIVNLLITIPLNFLINKFWTFKK